MSANPLAIIGQVFQGYETYRADNQQAGLDQYNADLAIQNATTQANQKVTQVQNFTGQQEEEYLNSGVQIAGSPALMLNNSVRLGQQEVDAIMKTGANQAFGFNNQAYNAQQAGRAALIGSFLGAGSSATQQQMVNNYNNPLSTQYQPAPVPGTP